MMTASWKLLVSLAVVLGLVLASQQLLTASAAAFPEAQTIARGAADFDELSARFVDLAERKGAVYAFDILRVAPLPSGTDLHLLGHVVGDELYKQNGIEGIEHCTQEFRNACSHSIVIGTLNEFGAVDATIEMIRTACMRAPGGPGAYTMCFHGLGHGVFAYFGYDIPQTVAFCERLGSNAHGHQEYGQCVGGMIMELLSGGGHDNDKWLRARETYLDPADPLAPCNRTLIPDVTKNHCYSYLTPHLFTAAGADLGDPDPGTYPRAFSFCDKVRESDLRDVCYGGFGKEFVPLAAARDIRAIDQMSDAALAKASSWCMLAPHDDAVHACIDQGLSSVYWGGENDPAAAFRFCALIGDAGAQDACYESLATNVGTYRSGAEKERECALLPSVFQARCASIESL